VVYKILPNAVEKTSVNLQKPQERCQDVFTGCLENKLPFFFWCCC